jgi:hypothetical protein
VERLCRVTLPFQKGVVARQVAARCCGCPACGLQLPLHSQPKLSAERNPVRAQGFRLLPSACHQKHREPFPVLGDRLASAAARVDTGSVC